MTDGVPLPFVLRLHHSLQENGQVCEPNAASGRADRTRYRIGVLHSAIQGAFHVHVPSCVAWMPFRRLLRCLFSHRRSLLICIHLGSFFSPLPFGTRSSRVGSIRVYPSDYPVNRGFNLPFDWERIRVCWIHDETSRGVGHHRRR